MPKRKWLIRCFRYYEEAGGWIGAVTVKALKPYICDLYRSGATAEATGKAAADHYRLYSANATMRENADIRSEYQSETVVVQGGGRIAGPLALVRPLLKARAPSGINFQGHLVG